VVSRQNRAAHLNREWAGLNPLSGWCRGGADRRRVGGFPRSARARSGGCAACGWTGGWPWPGCPSSWRMGGPGPVRRPWPRRRWACCV